MFIFLYILNPEHRCLNICNVLTILVFIVRCIGGLLAVLLGMQVLFKLIWHDYLLNMAINFIGRFGLNSLCNKAGRAFRINRHVFCLTNVQLIDC